MGDEGNNHALDDDALAILARRKRLLASAALSLAMSCETRQEPPATEATPPASIHITLPQSEPAPELPASTPTPPTQPSVRATPPPIKAPCLKPVLRKPHCLSEKPKKSELDVICLYKLPKKSL